MVVSSPCLWRHRIDARIQFRFGLFAENTCRVLDGIDNETLGPVVALRGEQPHSFGTAPSYESETVVLDFVDLGSAGRARRNRGRNTDATTCSFQWNRPGAAEQQPLLPVESLGWPAGRQPIWRTGLGEADINRGATNGIYEYTP